VIFGVNTELVNFWLLLHSICNWNYFMDFVHRLLLKVNKIITTQHLKE